MIVNKAEFNRLAALLLLIFGYGCVQRTHNSYPLRTEQFIRADRPLFIAVSTQENPVATALFKRVQDLGYDLHVVDDVGFKPEQSQRSKQFFWPHRVRAYQTVLRDLVDNRDQADRLVVLSDANDVYAIRPATEFVATFKSQDYRIILSGMTYCCNIYLEDYAKQIAKLEDRGGVFEYNSPEFDPDAQEEFWLRAKSGNHALNPESLHGRAWTESFKTIVDNTSALLKRNNRTEEKYRFVNAGQIAGYAGALLETMSKVFDVAQFDDEERWNLWYSKNGLQDNLATIDYGQEFFQVIPEWHESWAVPIHLASYQVNDISQLPRFLDPSFSKEIKPNGVAIKALAFGSYPFFLHCPNCKDQKRLELLSELY
jgi:hypothetical protein